MLATLSFRIVKFIFRFVKDCPMSELTCQEWMCDSGALISTPTAPRDVGTPRSNGEFGWPQTQIGPGFDPAVPLRRAPREAGRRRCDRRRGLTQGVIQAILQLFE